MHDGGQLPEESGAGQGADEPVSGPAGGPVRAPLRTSRQLFFIMVQHPVRGWQRTGMPYPSKPAAAEWVSFVKAAWHGLPTRVKPCTVHFEDGKLTDQSRQLLSETFNLDVTEGAEPAPVAAQEPEATASQTVSNVASPGALAVADEVQTAQGDAYWKERAQLLLSVPVPDCAPVASGRMGGQTAPGDSKTAFSGRENATGGVQ